MDKTNIFIISLVIGLTIGLFCGGGLGYKTGQIDALRGHQEFKLVTNTISTVTWQPINK